MNFFPVDNGPNEEKNYVFFVFLLEKTTILDWLQNNAHTITLNYYARDHSDDTHPNRYAYIISIHWPF